MITENIYWVGFLLINKLQFKDFLILKNHFGSLEKAWQTENKKIKEANIISPLKLDEFLKRKNKINLNEIEDILEKNQIKTLIFDDLIYPESLKNSPSPPSILFYQGEIGLLNKYNKLVTVVGTRKNSVYGEKITTEIVDFLCQLGIITVSGLALGIDTIVHKISLKNELPTISVLGSSLILNEIYPAYNKDLAQKIKNNGLLLSPFPPATLIRRSNFPYRNRILANLSPTTIVTEASLKSGALNTAYLALNNNREIMACPYNVYTESGKGCNQLIKEGANVITQKEDLLNYLKIDFKVTDKKEIPLDLTKEEKEIITELKKNPLTADKIANLLNKPINIIQIFLSTLELKGLIKNQNSKYYF